MTAFLRREVQAPAIAVNDLLSLIIQEARGSQSVSLITRRPTCDSSGHWTIRWVVSRILHRQVGCENGEGDREGAWPFGAAIIARSRRRDNRIEHCFAAARNVCFWPLTAASFGTTNRGFFVVAFIVE